jgi:hypothetical protein
MKKCDCHKYYHQVCDICQGTDGKDIPDELTLKGRKITREKALEGLGDPATWKAESDALYKEFRMTPAEKVRQELKDEFDLGSI